jgi:phage terminase large subunit GpA-like protein
MTPKAEALFKRLCNRYAPAPQMRLSQWAEANIVLPEGQSARPGKYRNWPYFIEPLDSIGDLTVETVTIMKGTRIGYTKGLMVAIAATAANNPCPIGLLVPTDDDANDMSVDEVEPIFTSSPQLAGLLREGKNNGHTTMRRKSFAGGASLKILSARAPRKLRKHDIKYLFCDEVDGMEITAEGDPLALAKRRTMAHPDRKIVIGSTPTEEELSIVERSYQESDQRIFEIPCPHCAEFFELLWEHIQWSEGQPETAQAYCPHCGVGVDERYKRALTEKGRWVATRPEIKNHRGYRINALISLLPKAAWPILAEEFLRAKRAGPAELQPFHNTVLAKTWRTSINRLTSEGLAQRVEPWGLEQGIPDWVVMLTAGADVQDDRIEITVLGWPLVGAPGALGHVVIPGSTLEKETWAEMNDFLRTRWPHPNGWLMRLDAVGIDSGGSKGRTQRVYDFTEPRLSRRIFAIKGMAGPRPMWSRAARTKTGQPLFLVGHDQAKTAVMEALAAQQYLPTGDYNPHCLRVSDELTDEWFEQATGEVRRIRYVRNRAVIEFVPKRPGQRTEALDSLCYAWAVRYSPEVRSIDIRERAARRPVPVAEGGPQPVDKPKGVSDWSKRFNS